MVIYAVWRILVRSAIHWFDKWEELMESVRKLPQFTYFLMPVPFDQLCQAVGAEQIIIINASKYGVDALIFVLLDLFKHVPLPNIDLEELTVLSSEILLQQPAVPIEKLQQKYNSRYLKPALRRVWKWHPHSLFLTSLIFTETQCGCISGPNLVVSLLDLLPSFQFMQQGLAAEELLMLAIWLFPPM